MDTNQMDEMLAEDSGAGRPEEDAQILEALDEYVAGLDGKEAKVFSEKLSDPVFHRSMAKTLSEMAILIAGAAVLPDDADYIKLRRKVMLESRGDSPEAHRMRTHYLTHRQSVEMAPFLRSEAENERFRQRMDAFYKDYMEQTSYR